VKYIKAASLLVFALAVLANPLTAVRAQSQRIISSGSVQDIGAPRLPPW
jgi:hypothetical protein